MRKLDGSVDASHQLVSDGCDGLLGVGLGVVSSAGERGTACGSQTSRTGFIWAAEATSLVAVAGVKARWAEASAERAVPLKVRSRYPAVPDAWHAGRWPSRPVHGWSEGGRAQEGDGARKGAVMPVSYTHLTLPTKA